MATHEQINTRIFLDGSDAVQTREMIGILGFLDGQTTNPSNFAKSPEVCERIESGKKFGKNEVYARYKETIQEISGLIPEGSVSIEVYADKNTTAEQMLGQAREMFEWIPNAHIKLPIIREGLKAAEILVNEGKRVNMTLCFSQEQAAAVYSATKRASKGDVFISPFIGRLDDIGLNGIDLVRNIVEMYKTGDGHVEALAASIRKAESISESIAIGSEILTAPFKALKEWAENGMQSVDLFLLDNTDLERIPFEGIDLKKDWEEYKKSHELTDKGLEKFAADWKSLIAE